MVKKLGLWLAVLGSLFISEAIAQEPVKGVLSLSAKLQEHGSLLKEGVKWYIYHATPDNTGKYEQAGKYNKANPTILLPSGEYLVTATYGQAYLTQKVMVNAQKKNEQVFVINAGGLSVTSSFTSPLRVQQSRIRLQLYSGDTDQFGNRTLILKVLPRNKTVVLNAGIYHIVSRYGDVNAIVKGDVTVEAGKVTKAVLSHNAGHVTLKLVAKIGGEALPDTQWKLVSSVGEVIKTAVGAIPSFLLKSGEYAIQASRDGVTFEKKFTLESGQSLQIEVVSEEE